MNIITDTKETFLSNYLPSLRGDCGEGKELKIIILTNLLIKYMFTLFLATKIYN
jgi:hypothetical protein